MNKQKKKQRGGGGCACGNTPGGIYAGTGVCGWCTKTGHLGHRKDGLSSKHLKEALANVSQLRNALKNSKR